MSLEKLEARDARGCSCNAGDKRPGNWHGRTCLAYEPAIPDWMEQQREAHTRGFGIVYPAEATVAERAEILARETITSYDHPMDRSFVMPEGLDEYVRSMDISKAIKPGSTAGHINPKDIAGSRKVPFRLVPWGAMVGVAKVLAEGARKYGPFNWRHKPIGRMAYYEAALRHITAAMDGEDIDPESSLAHIDHAIAGLLIERDATANGTCKDDRHKHGVTGDLIRASTKRA